MRSAFLVVVTDPGVELAPHVRALVDRADPPRLAFECSGHTSWCGADGNVHVGAWQEEPAEPGGAVRWRQTTTGFATVAGAVRRIGHPWGPEESWVDALTGALAATGTAGIQDGLTGSFVGAVVESSGTGRVVNDPLGLGFLFIAEASDRVAIASHPSLAAWAVAPPDRPPALDPWAACLLAYSRIRLGDRTGYAGVRALPVGASIELAPGRRPIVVTAPHAWLPTADMAGLTPEALVDRAGAAIGEVVASTLSYPVDEAIVELTGGKDSRAVLSVVLAQGLGDRFVFRTDGPPQLQDVAIAGELASVLGLRHRSGIRFGEYGMTYAQRVFHFVETTAGMNNVWSLKTRSVPNPAEASNVRLNGLFGEAMRSQVRMRLDTPDDAVRLWVDRFGELGLVRPDIAVEYAEHAADAVRAAGPEDASPCDLADAFRLSDQTRNTFGPRDDHTDTPHLFPLAALGAIRAGFALGPEARNTEQVHRGLMERAGQVLVETRFTDAGWPRPAPAFPPPPPRTRPPKPPSAAGKAPNLHQLMAKADPDTPRAVLAEIFADASNDAWSILDRAVALDALARLDQLDPRERQELYGAATAVVWLGFDG